jgi:hypothetical protein
MRHLLLVTSLACLLGSPACMVVEEIDNAAAKMPTTKAEKRKESEPAPAESSFAAKKDAVLETSKQWWGRATSLSSERVDESVVQCAVGGRSQFMSRADCLARGGRPSGL